MPASNPTITRVPGIRVGHTTDRVNVTGCTALHVPPDGARCVVDVRGGAPGTRETAVLDEGSATPVHAIVLSGGSAFGLATADGVMAWLAERGIGFQTLVRPVPIVPAAIIFDLGIGQPNAPTPAMGYAAAAGATDAPVECGSVGAGTGATVGKLAGRAHALQSGIGSAAETVTLAGETYVVGALFAVNAVGDVWDVRAGQIAAGAHDVRGWLADRPSADRPDMDAPPTGTNTTIGIVATDAPLSRKALRRMVISAHDGLARAIRPAHTATDGDTIFALTTAQDERPLGPAQLIPLSIGVERAVEAAILNAVLTATARADLPAARDLPHPPAPSPSPKDRGK